ncbi:TonB-dependent receptor [uncultured Dokdonia sp.]|uniref:TonB-dependent receptor plug domain-containing protein n=1 Tax=uncultured Dokdonia sp. TaxID=575653 RepID=UPI0026388FCF|nr:TonB-dependent receptor [uncultured Dokdonia sp.]
MRHTFILFLLITIASQAQQITVLDIDTREPIISVAIYNEDKSVSTITDFDGKADISAFAKAEKIIFSEVAHQQVILTKAQIIAYGNNVFLRKLENTLGEIVLSVSKFGQKKSEIPQKIVGFSKEDIELYNPQTAADLLQTSGQVFVQKSQLGGGSPSIRGYSTNRLLITLDGIRFNTAIFRGGNVQNIISIDPFALERTEVILGPGSVVYGSDAVGGVLNFYTKKPTLSKTDTLGFTVSGNALARYSTSNNEKTGHFDFNLGSKKWAFLTSASYSDYGDQRQGSHGPDAFLRNEFIRRIDGEDVVLQNDDPLQQVSTGYSSYNFMQKVRYVPNNTWDFNFNVSYATTSNYDRYDRLTQRDDDGNLRSAQWFYGPQKWLLASLQVNKEGRGPWYDRVQGTIAFQNSEESRNDRRVGRTGLRTRTERVNALSGALDFEKALKNRKTKFNYGLEYVYNYINSNGSITDIETGLFELTDTRYPDGSEWQSLAAYVSGQFDLSSKLKLNSGLRYNQLFIFTDFRGNNQFFNFPFEKSRVNFGNVTGSAGLNYQLSKTVLLKTNLSTAFRAPNIDDIGKVFDSGDGDLIIPNPDLKAEYAYNAEIGTVLNFSNVVTFDANVYYSQLENALVRRDFTLNGSSTIEFEGETVNIEAIQNAGTAQVWGFEAGIDIKLPYNFNVTSQFNITRGEQEEEDGSLLPVRHVSPTFGNTHLIWKKDKWTLNAFVNYNGALDFQDLSPEVSDSPELFAVDADGNPFSPKWYTLNLSSQFRLNDHWHFTGNLENITDQRYRTYASGISAAGRNLILSAKYSF